MADQLSRRHLLQTGGLGVTLGALMAACGGSAGGSEPGRVGYAPPITPLPAEEPDDAVLLRTAMSMEYLMLDLYGLIAGEDALGDDARRIVDRFIEDHQAAADTMAGLTTDAGGEPYECPNSWYSDRIVPEIFKVVTGDEASGIEPSDEPADDLLRISYGFETMVSGMYQKMVELLDAPALRSELMLVGALAARHAALVAMTLTGVPDGYISPVVLGGELTPDESGRAELFAVSGAFGSLASTELVLGAPNAAGTRAGIALETPAENAYVYPDETCPA